MTDRNLDRQHILFLSLPPCVNTNTLNTYILIPLGVDLNTLMALLQNLPNCRENADVSRNFGLKIVYNKVLLKFSLIKLLALVTCA